jgi:hypothetical protein
MMNGRLQVFALLMVALGAALPARAEQLDHGGPPVGGRAVAPSSEAKLYNLVNACMAGRPGTRPFAPSLGGGGGAATGGAALFQQRCLSCHGMKDAQASINCINGAGGTCGQTGFTQMPPDGPLPPQEKAAIVRFLQTGA